MRHFVHEEPPWECQCTRPYRWDQVVKGRVVVDIDRNLLDPPNDITYTADEAVQLNYIKHKIDPSNLCKKCKCYRHRIIPNPYRRGA